MNAEDPILHAQLQHIANSARKAVGASRTILIVEFRDEKKEECFSMMMFDHDEGQTPKEQVVSVTTATISALQSMLGSITTLQLMLKNKSTGEMIPIETFEAGMIEMKQL